jgi:dTDP-4-dehydrorhamnose reductase
VRETILLLGANGQVGHELARALLPLGTVHAATREQVDLSDPQSLERAFATLRPSWVVNAAAYTAVDKAESETALANAINYKAVEAINTLSTQYKTRLIHYSTDYVFDGTKQGAYDERDATNPQSVYGASKLSGEQAALENSDALVLRLSWVFGEHGANFPKTMLRLASQKPELRVVADQTGCPTPAALVADITLLAMRARLRGLYHLCSSEVTTWHAFAQATLACAGVATPVVAITTADYPTAAKRPANSALDCRKLERDLGVNLPSWRPYLQRMVSAMQPTV